MTCHWHYTKPVCPCMLMIQPYTHQQPQLMKSLKPLINKELQSVLEWVASNKLVLNFSKTKSIVFGTNHSLSSRSQLNLVMNGVAVEQVEETILKILNCHGQNI